MLIETENYSTKNIKYYPAFAICCTRLFPFINTSVKKTNILLDLSFGLAIWNKYPLVSLKERLLFTIFNVLEIKLLTLTLLIGSTKPIFIFLEKNSYLCIFTE